MDYFYRIISTSDGKLSIDWCRYTDYCKSLIQKLDHFVNKGEVFHLYACVQNFRLFDGYTKTALYVQSSRKLLLRNIVDAIESRLGMCLLGLPCEIRLSLDGSFTIIFNSKL
mgnify:FL=1